MFHGRTSAISAAAVISMTWSLGPPARAEDLRKVEFTRRDGSIEINIGGQPFATYVYDDPQIPRPYFARVHAPGGIQVTRNHPPIAGQDTMDHPEFHPGIWLAFGDVSGNDYWRLNARINGDGADYSRSPLGDAGYLSVANRYLAGDDDTTTICRETGSYTIRVRPAGYLLTMDSTFHSSREFSFGDQEEMGLGIRVATPLRVEAGDGSLPPGTGTILDAEGRRNGAEVGGNSADWCDYSGTLADQQVGITIFCHPDNFRPSWFHARDYGFLAANAFGRAAFHKGAPSKVVVKPGERLRLRYGILLHAGPPGEPLDLDAAYADYQHLAGGNE